LISATDANGNKVQTENNPMGESDKITDANGAEILYFHDDGGNLVKIVNPNNKNTTMEYDDAGRILSVTDPSGNAEHYEYNSLGMVSKAHYANGNNISYTYDTLNRLVKKTDSREYSVNYKYDSTDNILSINDSNSYSISYTYDNLNNIISITDDNGLFRKTISYTYDASGRRITMTANGNITRYDYDFAGRLSKIISSTGETSYQYDNLSRRTKIIYPNNAYTEYQYDSVGNLLKITSKKSNGNIISSYSYTYDAVGNKLSMKDNSGRITSYYYDKTYRLIRANSSDGTYNEYEYDLFGNRLKKISNSGTTLYTYGSDDKLLTAGTAQYEYDANGNQIKKSEAGQNTTYEYNTEDRLIKATLPNGKTVQYTYGPTGQRTSRTDENGTVYFLYDSNDVLMELNSAGNQLAKYTFGPGIDEPISMTRSGSTYYYHTDGIGSVTALTDTSQNTAASYTYDEFGVISSQTGTINNQFKYTSRENDPTVGLYYYRARFYDSTTGRFLSKDPLRLYDENRYAYVNNNPVNFVDPLGLWSSRMAFIYSKEFITSLPTTVMEQSGAVVEFWRNAGSGVEWGPTEGSAAYTAGYYGGKKAQYVTQGILGVALVAELIIGGYVAAPFVQVGYVKAGGAISGGYTAIKNSYSAISNSISDAYYRFLFSKSMVRWGEPNNLHWKLPKVFGYKIHIGFNTFFGWIPKPTSLGLSIPEFFHIGIGRGHFADIHLGLNNIFEYIVAFGLLLSSPGNDHPDDNNDLSIIYNDNPVVSGSAGISLTSDARIAVFMKGYYKDLGAMLVGMNKSIDLIEPTSDLGEMKKYPVIIIPSGGLYGIDSSDIFKQKLEQYVSSGGVLVMFAQQRGYEFSALPGGLSGFGWAEDQSCQGSSVRISTYHPIVSGQSSTTQNLGVDGYFTSYPNNATILLTRTKNSMPAMLLYNYGNGTVIASTIYEDWAYAHYQSSSDARNIIKNMLSWLDNRNQNISSYATGDDIKIRINVTNYVNVPANKIVFELVDIDGNFILNKTIDTPTAAFGRTEVEFTTSAPSRLGIINIHYSLMSNQYGEIEKIHNAEKIIISKYSANTNGFVYAGNKIAFSISSNSENYAYGTNGLFTTIVWNNDDVQRNIMVKYWFPHHYWIAREPEYGGDWNDRNLNLEEILNIPSHSSANFTHTLRNIRIFDRMWAYFYDYDTEEYIGVASRGFYDVRPTTRINISTDKTSYNEAETVNVILKITSQQDVPNARITFNVMDSGGNIVLQEIGSDNLSASIEKIKYFNFILPGTYISGEYIVYTEIETSIEVGGGSTQFRYIGANGTFYGKVIDLLTNNPISNAEIRAEAMNILYNTTTDVNGNYNITLPGNYYNIEFSKSGYNTGRTWAVIYPYTQNQQTLYTTPNSENTLFYGSQKIIGKVRALISNAPISGASIVVDLGTNNITTSTD
ncbi:MAG: RHS repeat-associated core domain-containing protein, partial [Candidatus Aenigmatarchaeota archaeon]